MSGARLNPKSTSNSVTGNRRPKRRRGASGRGRLNNDEGGLNWRMQHHPLGEDRPALIRTQITDAAGNAPPAYPMRAGDTVEALERKGRIDERAAAGARKFEAVFHQASLQGLANRDLRMMPGSHKSGGSEPHSILYARDGVWEAMCALGGIGTPGANIAWDVLGLGMTIKAHAE
ncbi:MAG: hypothetical protein HOC72_05185, partial [Rhodospirillaceae bacterium]|nr:hypothetical protein [Rhodospirillaceae bacterium]